MTDPFRMPTPPPAFAPSGAVAMPASPSAALGAAVAREELLVQIGTKTKLGSTETEDVDRCDRLWWLKHVRNLAQKQPPPGRMSGTLFHVCMRYWYAQFLPEQPVWFMQRDMVTELNRVGRGSPALIEKARLMLETYVQQFGEVDRAWKITDLETTYSVPLEVIAAEGGFKDEHPDDVAALFVANERPTMGIDFGGERPDGTQHIIDYKTMHPVRGGLPAWNATNNAYILGWQPLMYQWLARRARKENGDLAFPRLGSFLIQRVLNEAPFTSDRQSITFPEQAMRDVPRVLARRLVKRLKLKRWLAEGKEPVPAYGHACNAYGGCDFGQACKSYDFEATLELRYKEQNK